VNSIRSQRTSLLAAAAVLLAMSFWAPSADAVGPRTLKGLRQAECPPDYRPGGIKAEYSQADIEDALEDERYLIAAGVRVVIPTPPPSVDWHQDPINSQTFRNGLASLNWTQVLFAAYLEGGQAQQEQALEQAAALIIDWIQTQQRGGPTTTEEAWGSKRAGDRLTLISYLARIGTCERDSSGDRLLSKAEAAILLDSVVDHARYIERHRSSNNHGLFDAYALAVAAENLRFMKQAKHWRNLGVNRFENVLRERLIEEEGIWLDHSTTYHFAAVSLLERLLQLPHTGDRSLRRLRTTMQKASAGLVEKPNGARLQWGDSNGNRSPAEFAAAAESLDGMATMRRSGLAFVREDDSYLAMLASYHNRVHKHSDELSFGLFDRGHQIISDTGDYERDAGAWRDFTTSAYAHSTVTVDGQTFPRTDAEAYGSGIIATGSAPAAGGGNWYAARTRNPLVNAQGVSHHRWFLYKPREVLVIVDRLRSELPHAYTRYFHLGPDIAQAARAGGGLNLSADSFDGSLIDRSAGVASTLHTIRGRGQNAPSGSPFPHDPGGLQGWTSPGFEEAVERWTAALYTPSATDADFITSIGLDSDDTRGSLISSPTSGVLQVQLRTGPEVGGSAGPALQVVRDGAELEITESP
jgi:hypothetical protein